MRTSNSYSSGGNTGARKKKSTRNRTNRVRRVSHKQEQEESGFFSQIACMETTIRAQALSARLHFYKHQAAWWKSQFVAAQFENGMLRQLLDQHYQAPKTSYLPKQFSSYYKNKNSHSQPQSSQGSDRKTFTIMSSSEPLCEDSENSDAESGEYELTEEFKQFLDINRRHREERDREKAKKRKERGSESETERVDRMEQEPLNLGEAKRSEQLRQLYGERWRQVEGLETHAQMKHDQFCDRHQPVYWPNIPLNL